MSEHLPDSLCGAPQEVIDAYRGLSGQRRAFALLLPMAGSQEEAALMAGYKPSNAKANAHKIAKLPGVKAVSDYLIGAALKAAELNIAECYAELAKLVRADPASMFDEDGALLPPQRWAASMGAAIAEVQQIDLYAGSGDEREKIGVTNKVKFVDKTSTLNLAFKLLDAFPEKKKAVTHTHRVGLVVVPAKNVTQQNADALEGSARRIEQPKPKGNAPAFMVRKVRELASD